MHLFPISLCPSPPPPPPPPPVPPLCSLQSSALRCLSLTCTKNAFSAGENLRSIYITWWALSFSLQLMSLALCHASYSICFIIYAPSFVSLSPSRLTSSFSGLSLLLSCHTKSSFPLFFSLISQVHHLNLLFTPQRCPHPFFFLFGFNSPYLTIPLQHTLSSPTCIHI